MQKFRYDKKILILNENIGNSTDSNIIYVEPLEELFGQCVTYDYARNYRDLGGKLTNKAIIKLFNRVRPDVVLLLTSAEQVYKSTIRQMTESGSVTIGWFFDDNVNFDSYAKWWGEVLSYCVTFDREIYDSYRSLGINAILTSNLANPQYFYPRACPKKYDVSFIGTARPNRKIFFQDLSKRGVTVAAFGVGWNDYLPLADRVTLYSESKININLCASYAGFDIMQLKGRIFEITMSGGFLLTDYAPFLEDYFEIGKEIVCFTSPEDARDKIEYYLCHDKEREKVAIASRRRALKDYTCDHVLRNLFDKIEMLESQKKSNYTEDNIIDISRNHGTSYWPKKSWKEKRKHQRETARFFTRSGDAFLMKKYFIIAINEYIHAFRVYPLSIFNCLNLIYVLMKKYLQKIIPQNWRKKIKEVFNIEGTRIS